MITGLHALIFSPQPEAVRAFLRDKVGWASVDDGDGWLVFALPPAELGVHPAGEPNQHQLYLMCDDIGATMQELGIKGVEFTGPPEDQGFGLITAIKLPDGGRLHLYQAKHKQALGLVS